MSEVTRIIEKTPQQGDIFALLGSIVQLCFDRELLERQHGFSLYRSDYNPIDAGVRVTLACREINGELEHTYIGNVHSIKNGTTIDAYARVGNYAVIKPHVSIGEHVEVEAFASLEAGACILPKSRIERGALIMTGASVGSNSVVSEGSEIGYDLSLSAHETIKPFLVASQAGCNNEYVVYEKPDC